MNEGINVPQVRVIGADGQQLGIMATSQALKLAREESLDLVEVAPTNSPPVCRILDYGRLLYLSSKKDRESRKSQKNTALREVRLRPNIGAQDLAFKIKKVRELLNEGDKVKLAVFFRGREVTHQQAGMSILRQVADNLKEEAKLEQAPSFEQRHLSIILAPLPRRSERKLQSKEEAADAEDQDPQGGAEAVRGDGVGTDNAPQAHEQPQPAQEAQKGASAVRR